MMRGCVLDLSGSRQDVVTGFCEHRSDPSSSVKGVFFLLSERPSASQVTTKVVNYCAYRTVEYVNKKITCLILRSD